MLQNYTKETIEESGIIFTDEEKHFFTTDDDRCLTYVNKDGIKEPSFINEKKRLQCVQYFLAYHSYDIGHPDPKIDLPNSFIYLEYNGDREVFESMTKPSKYKDLIKWKCIYDISKDDLAYKLLDTLEPSSPPFTTVVIKVNRYNEDTLLFLSPIKIRSYELYTEAPLPWYVPITNPVTGKTERILAHLSRFQYDLIYGRGIACDFYTTDKGNEPLITDRDKRYQIFINIITRLHMMGKLKKEVNNDNQIIVLRFKGGDRDIMRAYGGTLFDKYYSYEDASVFEKEEYYDKIKEFMDKSTPEQKATAILVLSYHPDNDNLLYYVTTAISNSELKIDI